MGEIATKEVFDWLHKTLRLLELPPKSLGSWMTWLPQERGHIASSIECYMKQHGVSGETSIRGFHKQLENAWKDINEECLRPTAVPMLLLVVFSILLEQQM
ncbi:Sesquiterpene synthase [Vitis vinifera]|uniref:Sesquiterpene synthase n=1 Tax=Vitis vinifera TaxID=29760 RepID=A0A438G7K6_VITVI|nr:Sesquiterpene synthase [Vitis vinifera]